jgi:hypothetical protein
VRRTQETFRLYAHKGLNYSAFQNDVQIAAFTKNRIVVGKGNQYDVPIKPENPCYIKLVNSWLILNSGGGDAG